MTAIGKHAIHFETNERRFAPRETIITKLTVNRDNGEKVRTVRQSFEKAFSVLSFRPLFQQTIYLAMNINRLKPGASTPLTSPIEFERTHRFFSAIGVLVSVVVCCCVCVCLWARERRKRFWCSSMHNIVRILYMSFFFILIWGVNIDMKEYFYNDNFNIFEIYVKFWTSWSV